ncbi:MAG: hypothetical protein LBO68_00720, partial [Synergistaceae bacterium]|nr:hypothetical protein [Synergistaceae bacterium]
MKDRIFYRGSTITPEKRIYLERRRIHRLMEDAARNQIVTVSAGAGYGKTQGVYAFLRKQEMVTTWIQLSERDNLGTRFWENCVYTIALYDRYSKLAERLQEIGFPETDEQFAKCISALEDEAVAISEKKFIVFDDLHLIKDKLVLQFIKRLAQLSFPNTTTILISRTEPDINTIGLLSKGLVSNVNEDDLRFTEEEIIQYFQLLGIPLSSQSIANICDDTKGWPFALHLVGLSLKKEPRYEQAARSSMKLNIFKMIENEVFFVISERLQRFLIQLSLIDHLSTDLVSTLAGDNALVDEMKEVSSFVRHDFYTNTYLIHHLFLDYLRRKQDILTEQEKHDTYLKAALWCDENDYKIDAISYYNKIGEYRAIVGIVYYFPAQIPFNEAKFLLDIYDNAPAELLE